MLGREAALRAGPGEVGPVIGMVPRGAQRAGRQCSASRAHVTEARGGKPVSRAGGSLRTALPCGVGVGKPRFLLSRLRLCSVTLMSAKGPVVSGREGESPGLGPARRAPLGGCYGDTHKHNRNKTGALLGNRIQVQQTLQYR